MKPPFLLSVLVLAAPMLHRLQAQEATPAPEPAVSSFTSTVRVVTVDVSVSDKSGAPMHGLHCADFHLQESKVEQTLQRCEEHRFVDPATTVPASTAPASQPNVFSNASTLPLPETLDVVLVDYLNSGERQKLNDVVLNLTRTAPPGHRVAVFSLAGKLRLVSGFTDDMRTLETKIGRSVLPTQTAALGSLADDLDPGGVLDPALSLPIPGLADFKQMAQEVVDDGVVRLTLEALEEVDKYVGALHARKNLLWVTSGVPTAFSDAPPPTGHLDYPEERTHFDHIIADFARDRIVVYPIDVRGVINDYFTPASTTGIGVQYNETKFKDAGDASAAANLASRSRMDQVADRTGGHAYYGNNDTNFLVHRSLTAGSEYYTLSYVSQDHRVDDRLRPFRIDVDKPGSHLNYRSGYRSSRFSLPQTAEVEVPLPDPQQKKRKRAAPAPETPEQARVARALLRGLPDSTGLLFAVQASRLEEKPVAAPERSRRGISVSAAQDDQQHLRFLYRINADDLAWTVTPEGRTAEVSLLLAAYDKHSDLRLREDHKATLKLTTQQYQALAGKGVPLVQNVALPAKEPYTLRVGLQDLNSLRIGTLEIPTATVVDTPGSR